MRSASFLKVQETAKKADPSIPNGKSSPARSPYLEGTQPPGFVDKALKEVSIVVLSSTQSHSVTERSFVGKRCKLRGSPMLSSTPFLAL